MASSAVTAAQAALDDEDRKQPPKDGDLPCGAAALQCLMVQSTIQQPSPASSRTLNTTPGAFPGPMCCARDNVHADSWQPPKSLLTFLEVIFADPGEHGGG